MEDDNGLELSLGLSFGGLSSKAKGKNASSSDIRSDESDRVKMDDFNSFFNASSQKQQDSSNGGSQREAKENFFNDLSKPSFDGDASPLDLNGKGVFEEETGKRRMFFEEIGSQKKKNKHEREAQSQFADAKEKTRASPAADEGSAAAAENDDVAESEAAEEGSTSRLVQKAADPTAGGGGQKRFSSSSSSNNNNNNNIPENGFKLGNISYGSPFPGHPVMNMTFPLSAKEGNFASGVGPANISAQPVFPGNVPQLMFGYPPVQIPMLDKDSSSSWGLGSQPQLPFHPSFAGRGPPNSALMQVISHNSTEAAAQHDGRAPDRAKAHDGKRHISEEGSSSQAEEDGKAPERSASDGSALEFSAIKPGILAEVQFGGSGSCPNLPWVSTTGQNGRTISGVTYRFNSNQIRIVCACHGTHMSTDEFVRHANEEPGNNPDNANGLAAFPNTNPAASAQS